MKKMLFTAAVFIGLSTAAMAQKAAPSISPDSKNKVQNMPDKYRMVGKYMDKGNTCYIIIRPDDTYDASGEMKQINYNDFRVFYGISGQNFSATVNNGATCDQSYITIDATLGKLKIARHTDSGSSITIDGKEIPLEKF